MLESQFGSLPCLVELVKQCLHNVPDQRPSTEELLTRLQGMKAEVEGRYGKGAVMVDLVRVRLARELEIKDRRIQQQVYIKNENSMANNSF